jgi:putative hydrolase of the HAD superfamily
MNEGLIIFDGDDTLWETEFLYDQARDEAAELVAATGIDPDSFKELQRQIDVRNVEQFGLSKERFPTSSVEAYKNLARRLGDAISEDIVDGVYRASSAVFTRPAPLVDGARDVLDSLARDHALALLTKGDTTIQEQRIADSNLRPYFRIVSIVDEKDIGSFVQLLDILGAPAATAWSVGNSIRSDILPALELGMMAVWVEAYVWAHERHDDITLPEHSGLRVATSLRQVPALIGTEATQQAQEA